MRWMATRVIQEECCSIGVAVQNNLRVVQHCAYVIKIISRYIGRIHAQVRDLGVSVATFAQRDVGKELSKEIFRMRCGVQPVALKPVEARSAVIDEDKVVRVVQSEQFSGERACSDGKHVGGIGAAGAAWVPEHCTMRTMDCVYLDDVKRQFAAGV